MLNTTVIDDLNNSNIWHELTLVSFGVKNMFPSVNNKMGIIPVTNEQVGKVPLTHFVINVLELRLSCNNLVFNNTDYIQTYGTV